MAKVKFMKGGMPPRTLLERSLDELEADRALVPDPGAFACLLVVVDVEGHPAALLEQEAVPLRVGVGLAS